MYGICMLIGKVLDWSTDKIVGIGLVATLILSVCLGLDTNILTNIISGLFGYMSKTILTNKKEKEGE